MVMMLEDRTAPAALTVNSLLDAPVSGTSATLTLREALVLIDSSGTATDAAGNLLSTAKASQIDATTPFGEGDTITFDGSVLGQGSVTLSQGELLLTANVNIIAPAGQQLAIDGNNASRVLEIAAGASVGVTSLAIVDGNAVSGAGIVNAGSLTLVDSEVSGNVARLNNGGIVNYGGVLNLIDSSVTGNTAGVGNGGIANYAGTMSLINTTVSGNSASGAAGIGNYGGTMSLVDTTVSGNTGGGILNTGTLELTGSTILGNSAVNGAGVTNTGSLTMEGSTVAGNAALANDGGILNFSGGTVTISDSVISGNSAALGNGGIANYDATLTLEESIVSGNTAAGGGGIGNNGGTITLLDSTINDNTGGDILNNGTLTLNNSSVGNTASGLDGPAATGDGLVTPINTAISTDANSSASTVPSVVSADSDLGSAGASAAPGSGTSIDAVAGTGVVTSVPGARDTGPAETAATGSAGPLALGSGTRTGSADGDATATERVDQAAHSASPDRSSITTLPAVLASGNPAMAPAAWHSTVSPADAPAVQLASPSLPAVSTSVTPPPVGDPSTLASDLENLAGDSASGSVPIDLSARACSSTTPLPEAMALSLASARIGRWTGGAANGQECRFEFVEGGGQINEARMQMPCDAPPADAFEDWQPHWTFAGDVAVRLMTVSVGLAVMRERPDPQKRGQREPRPKR
jgi:hypothetical protein